MTHPYPGAVVGERGASRIRKVRQWMNTNAWVVSELAIALFIGLEIGSLAGD
ncbi:MAG: hypothetical protein ACJ77Z_01115 [Thermoleophilaceae bacterium]